MTISERVFMIILFVEKQYKKDIKEIKYENISIR